MNDTIYPLLVIALPILGFVLLSFFGKGMKERSAGGLATLLMGGSLYCALTIAWTFFETGGTTIELYAMEWLRFNENLRINIGIGLDRLSVMMLVVITSISFLVHLYSTSYMHKEERVSSYFAYLQLFTTSMLGLVISINIFQMYFFWELVGVSSFLLIGFYFKRQSAIEAAKKAFIVTRFADLGFLIGILIIGTYAQSFDFEIIIAHLGTQGSIFLNTFVNTQWLGIPVAVWGTLLVFMGGAGKSAMFPLHIWLPDAMEGPTPVSALIHAATMVVAGVFLVARLFPIFAVAAPQSLYIVALTGGITALFAAVIACTQTDFKRVLAYSTISQIAFMMLAMGSASVDTEYAEGYVAALFHLFTHAFFKAALFLCAGVVIHAVGTGALEQLGGLRKRLPITHLTFLVAALSISGFPFFSGFFSKEAILHAVWNNHPELYIVALITSILTAFYMFRLYFLVFHHHKAHKQEQAHHAQHREPWAMAFPLLVLMILSVVAGYVNFGHYVYPGEWPVTLHLDWTFSIAPVFAAFAGFIAAMLFYYKRSSLPGQAQRIWGTFYVWAFHKFYIDELYLFIAQKLMIGGVGEASSWIDRNVVLRTIQGIANGTITLSESIKRMQSGRIQTYGFFFLGGVLFIAVILILKYIDSL